MRFLSSLMVLFFVSFALHGCIERVQKKDSLPVYGSEEILVLGEDGLDEIENITLQINADSPEKAKQTAEEAAKKLLANQVMEYFEVSVN